MTKRLFSMMFVLFCAVMFIASFGCSPYIQKPKFPDIHTIDHIKQATVALVIKNGTKYRSYCAGIWVSQDKILTSYHCLADEDNIFETPSDVIEKTAWFSTLNDYEYTRFKRAYSASVIGAQSANDLILLKATNPPEHEIVELATGEILDGSPIFTIGHPAGLTYTYTQGVVAATRIVEVKDTMKVLQGNIAGYFGNSGGGVFDANGRLLGICAFIYKVPSTTFFIHRDTVEMFLKDYNK